MYSVTPRLQSNFEPEANINIPNRPFENQKIKVEETNAFHYVKPKETSRRARN